MALCGDEHAWNHNQIHIAEERTLKLGKNHTGLPMPIYWWQVRHEEHYAMREILVSDVVKLSVV